MTHSFPTRRVSDLLNRSWQRREQNRLANSTGLIVIGKIAPEPRGFRRGLVAEHGPTRKRASRLMRSDRTLARRGGRAIIAPRARLRSRRRSAIAHHRAPLRRHRAPRSEEHTSELPSLMRNSYAVFCLQKKNKNNWT